MSKERTSSKRTEGKAWEAHPFHRALTQGTEHFLMTEPTETLKNAVQELVPETERPTVSKAIDFAERVHAGQMREDGKTPHIKHVLRVAYRVAKARNNGHEISPAQVLTGILHDTEEDYPLHPDDKATSQHCYRAEFTEVFGQDDLAEEVYAGVSAMNKYSPSGKKPEAEYHEGITEQNLWGVKAVDRTDSLAGDLAVARTKDYDKRSLNRVKRSLQKTERILPLVTETDAYALEYAESAVDYAKKVIGEEETQTLFDTTVHAQA